MNTEQSPSPYRQSAHDPIPEHDAVRDGRFVRIPAEDGRLPDRCILCNAPADFYRKHQKVRRGRTLPLAILDPDDSNHTCLIEVPLCPSHRRRDALGSSLTYGGYVVLVAAMLFMIAGWLWPMIGGLGLGLVLMLVGGALRVVVRPVQVSHDSVWIRACQPFMSSIPAAEDL